MRTAAGCVARVLLPHARPYAESRYAFEVFGMDFLVRADGTPCLVEVNDKVGYGFLRPDKHAEAFSEAYFDWIRRCVYDPLLLGSKPEEEPLYECRAAERSPPE